MEDVSAPRVLVVDDSTTLRDMVAYTLASAGFAVVEASDGLEALKALEGQTVELIITDINMSNLDGIQLIERLRDSGDHRRTPIICLTTETSDNTKDAARAAGATGWISKPFDPDKLVQVARKVCL